MAFRAKISASGALGAGSVRGPCGPAGPQGEKGDTGFSPVVTTQTVPSGTVVTITDAEGDKSFIVKNGQGSGDMLASVYDPEGKAQQLAAKAELTAHTGNGNAHTSASEKAAWSGKSRAVSYSAVLPSSGWSASGDYLTQTVAVEGLAAAYTARPVIDVVLAGTDAESDKEIGAAYAKIASLGFAETLSGALVFKFPSSVGTPETNIPISVTVFE